MDPRPSFVGVCVAIALLAAGPSALAQEAAEPAVEPTVEPEAEPPNVVFTELGGPGFFGSVGYERIVGEWLSLRAGVGGFFLSFSLGGSSSTQGHVTFSISTSVLIGLGGSTTALELGVSIVPAVPALLLGAGSLGLRYQQPGEGMVLRIAYTPLVALASEDGAGFLTHWGGIALGKRFH